MYNNVLYLMIFLYAIFDDKIIVVSQRDIIRWCSLTDLLDLSLQIL